MSSDIKTRVNPADIPIAENRLGPFWCEDREVVRQIFVTVRDRSWREVRPTRWDCAIEDDGRRARISARHTSEDIDFTWHGMFQCDYAGKVLRFEFEGTAQRDMEVCRLGLVVLHPPEVMIGSRLSVVGPAGKHDFVQSTRISPQPVVDGLPRGMTEPFRSIAIERPDFGRLLFTFSGDLFEIEDQRNWGDSSFKTYCTPLRLGFPRRVPEGSVISHSVDILFEPAKGAKRIVSQSSSVGRFPRIGRAWDGVPILASTKEIGLSWRHMHVAAGADGGLAALDGVIKSYAEIPIELAIAESSQPKPDSEFLSLVAENRARIARILISGCGAAPPSAPGVESWREELTRVGLSEVPLLAACRGHFVEFNRGEIFPDMPVSGIAVALSPTVHGDDASLIADNIVTIGDIVETARALTRRQEVAVVPLAMYDHAVEEGAFSPRQVAAWLVATLIHASRVCVASVTLAQDVLTALAQLDDDGHRVLTALLESADAEVDSICDPALPNLHVAQLRKAGCRTRVIAANLGDTGAVSDRKSFRLIRNLEIPPFGVRCVAL